MKSKKITLSVMLVAALLATAGAIAYVMLLDRSEQRNLLTFYGNVDIRQVHMAFQVPGRITMMHKDEGDKVSAGELVAEIDPVMYEAEVHRSEAQVEAQQALLDELLAGSRPEEIAQAKARVRGAEARLHDAEKRRGRIVELAREEYVSQQELDNAAAAVETAQAEFEALQQVATLAEKGPRDETIASARAQLRAFQAALESARQQLAFTKLYAPTNGVIQNRILEPGDMASPQGAVYALALSDPVWIRAYVPEPDLGRINEGMRAGITTDTYPGKVYDGRVGYISPTAEFTPKQVQTTDLRTRLVYQVRVIAENPQGELRLGMPATVRLENPDGERGK